MKQTVVLIVEDDPAIRRGVSDALRFAGYFTLEAATGSQGLALARGSDCDLLLLDLVLPDLDGFEILRRLQSDRPGLPTIVMTARGAEDDRVRGLRTGADDYVVKPFGVGELMARVEAVLRRAPSRSCGNGRLNFADCSADLSAARVSYANGESKPLSEREVQLLRYLAANGDRIVDRNELLANVWGVDPKNLETRSVDMQVARLREKLHDVGDPPKTIVTVRGKGYRLVMETKQ